MSNIAGWWLGSHITLNGEVVINSFFANRKQSIYRVVGGKLFITNKRMVFCPHLLDLLTGGQKWAIYNSDVMRVGKKNKGGDIFAGGLRDRLLIEHSNGVELFVVNNLEEVMDIIEKILGGRSQL